MDSEARDHRERAGEGMGGVAIVADAQVGLVLQGDEEVGGGGGEEVLGLAGGGGSLLPPIARGAGQEQKFQRAGPGMFGGGFDEGGELAGAGLGVVENDQQRLRRPPDLQQLIGPGVGTRPQHRPAPGREQVGEMVGEAGLALPTRAVQQPRSESALAAPPLQLGDEVLAAVEGDRLASGLQQGRRRHRGRPSGGPDGGVGEVLELHRLQPHLRAAAVIG
ncbi:hypothetical protein EES46_34480 [Streptomyces sp. ADI98-10]|nr:hypothetical protein EES46_34480 [Streptomyces sp. ADI98-10]